MFETKDFEFKQQLNQKNLKLRDFKGPKIAEFKKQPDLKDRRNIWAEKVRNIESAK